MNWTIRHEGSPRVIDSLTAAQVLEGLLDGHWEPTDEVKGPNDTTWQAIENHPTFAEAAADLEPPPPRTYDDETRLDMNALIDVTLVLLIFFILTTSYAALQKRLEAPSVSSDKPLEVVYAKDIADQMILVSAKMENGKPVVRIEKKEIEPHRLLAEMRRFVKATSKTTLLLDHDGEVPQDLVVKIIDAAKGAGMDKVRLVVP